VIAAGSASAVAKHAEFAPSWFGFLGEPPATRTRLSLGPSPGGGPGLIIQVLLKIVCLLMRWLFGLAVLMLSETELLVLRENAVLRRRSTDDCVTHVATPQPGEQGTQQRDCPRDERGCGAGAAQGHGSSSRPQGPVPALRAVQIHAGLPNEAIHRLNERSTEAFVIDVDGSVDQAHLYLGTAPGEVEERT
jgi:hypothetical protein